VRHRHPFIGLFLACFLIEGAMSNTCPPTPLVDAATLQKMARQQHVDKGLLWELQKGGQRFYLYGTVHVARLEWDFPGPSVQRALKSAAKVAVELDITNPTVVQQLSHAMSVAGREPTPDEARLEDRIRKQFRQACLNEAAFSTASLSSRLTSLALLSARDEGLYPDYAIDAALVGFARAQGKQIVELESAAAQATAMEGDIESLQRDLERLESGETRRMIVKLAHAWARSDRHEIEDYFSWCNCQGSPKERSAMDHLIKDRNATLAEQLARFYESADGGFAAIGILHMVGTDTVLDALSRAGYTVQLISMNNQ